MSTYPRLLSSSAMIVDVKPEHIEIKAQPNSPSVWFRVDVRHTVSLDGDQRAILQRIRDQAAQALALLGPAK